jgi:hypothetical protein
MLQIVFQVVLCELCHDAIFLRVKDDKVKILVGDFQELAGDFFEFFWGGRITQALIPLPACVGGRDKCLSWLMVSMEG